MKNSPTESTDSNFGLNLLRFVAVLMVVFGHLMLFRSDVSIIGSQVAPLFGFLGVEILIVLSGFLIGHHFFEVLRKDGSSSSAAIWGYFKRIARKLLPIYYLVLVVVIVLSFLFGYSDLISWKYFFFLQNFGASMSSFFPESWGIAVVFWACMLLFAILSFHVKNPKSIYKSALIFWVTLFLMLISIACKYAYYVHYGNTTLIDWDQNIKSVVIFRLDSFYIGFLSAWVYLSYPSFWIKYKKVLLFGSFVLMSFLFVGVGYFRFLIDSPPFFWDVLYLPLTSFAISLTFPFVSQFDSKSILATSVFSFGASISYCLFLIHYSIVLQIFNHYLVLPDMTITAFLLFSVLYLLIAVFLGFVLHRFFERLLFRIGVKN